MIQYTLPNSHPYTSTHTPCTTTHAPCNAHHHHHHHQYTPPPPPPPPTHITTTQHYTVPDALAYFDHLLEDLAFISQLHTVHTWHSLKDRMVTFSHRDTSPLSRALCLYVVADAHKSKHQPMENANNASGKLNAGNSGGGGGGGARGAHGVHNGRTGKKGEGRQQVWTAFSWSPSPLMVCEAAGLPEYEALQAQEAQEMVTQIVIGV